MIFRRKNEILISLITRVHIQSTQGVMNPLTKT